MFIGFGVARITAHRLLLPAVATTAAITTRNGGSYTATAAGTTRTPAALRLAFRHAYGPLSGGYLHNQGYNPKTGRKAVSVVRPPGDGDEWASSARATTARAGISLTETDRY